MTDERNPDETECVLQDSASGNTGPFLVGAQPSALERIDARVEFQESLLNAVSGAGILQMVVQEGRIVYLGNHVLAREFGFNDCMIEARPLLSSIVHADDRARIMDCYRRCLAGEAGPRICEVALVTQSGQRREFEVSVSVEPGSCPRRIIAIGRDISKRQRADRETKEALEFADCIIKAVPDLLVEIDGAGRYVQVWDQHQVQGRSSEEIGIGRNIRDLLDAEVASAAIRQAKLTGTAHGEARSPGRQEGAVRSYEYFLSRMRKDAGGYGFLMLLRDVTERVRMQEQIAFREQLYRSLVESLPDIIVRYDRRLRRSFVSRTFEQFTQHSAAAVLGTSPFENWWATSPTDKNRAEHLAALRTALGAGRSTEKEVTFARADGESVRLCIRYIPEFDNRGSPCGVLTVARDVTAERALAERLQMTASVFGAAREGIMITDGRGRILEVNPAFSRITGFGRAEAVGAGLNAVLSGFDDSTMFRGVVRRLRAAGYWAGEVASQRKNGEAYTAQLDIVSVAEQPTAPPGLFAGERRQRRANQYVVILSDISHLKQYQTHLRHVAYHDDLTGLPNRMLLRERLAQAIERVDPLRRKVGILYLDLDGFKLANDNHGHATGDQILQMVAHRMAEHVRPCDTVARIGGDEFVAVLTDLSDQRECESTARRLLDVINEPIEADGRCFALSASMGVSLYPDDEQDPDTLLRNADHAMYSAKAAGRNRLIFYGSIADGKSRGDSRTTQELREALERDQLIVYYQPIVDVASGRIVEAEALARWQHPTRGVVPPSEFIPIAENSGLIHAVGERVFEHAARVAQEWNRRAVAPPAGLLRIAVNRSPRQFTNRESALRWLKHLTKEGISGRMLSVEITEGLLLEDRPEVFSQLEQMQAFGMTVSLDDFGTGYSALSYLKKFDIDCIKIDRSFIRDIVVDESDRAVVEAIIAIGKRLGIKLIAEGVETRAQAELLSAAGCDMAQGYFFAPPMREEEFLTFATSGRKFEFEAATLEFGGPLARQATED